MRSRGAKSCGSDGGCGGPGLGPPGTLKVKHLETFHPPLCKPRARAAGARRALVLVRKSFCKTGPPPTSATPSPVFLQSLVPVGLEAARGGGLGVLLPDLPSPQSNPSPR